MKRIKEFKQFLFEAKRGRPGVDWNTYLALFPYTQDDHDRFNSATNKRRRDGKESFTDPELFAENKYNSELTRRRKLKKDI
jgi:hypothetical protein